MKSRPILICLANLGVMILLVLLVSSTMQRLGLKWMTRSTNLFTFSIVILVFLNAMYKVFFIYRLEKEKGISARQSKAYEMILDTEAIEKAPHEIKTPFLFRVSLIFQMIVLVASTILFSINFSSLHYKVLSFVFVGFLGLSEIVTILYLRGKE